MDFQGYLRAIFRGWRIIIIACILASALSALLSYLIEPVYRSRATLLVTPRTQMAGRSETSNEPDSADIGAILRGFDTLGKRPVVNTYAEIMNSWRLRKLALADLDPQAGNYDPSTRLMPETNLLVIEVSGSNPQLVHDLTASIQKTGVQFIQNMRDPYLLEVLDETNLPNSPVQPNPQFNLLIGLLLGLGVGVGVVLIRQNWAIQDPKTAMMASKS